MGKSSISSSPTTSYIEATVGPRYYFTRDKIKAYGDAGVGLYSYNVGSSSVTVGSTTVTSSSISNNDFGMNIGAGVEVPISKDIDLMGKAKYHFIFTSGSTTTYGGIYGGINFRIPN